MILNCQKPPFKHKILFDSIHRPIPLKGNSYDYKWWLWLLVSKSNLLHNQCNLFNLRNFNFWTKPNMSFQITKWTGMIFIIYLNSNFIQKLNLRRFHRQGYNIQPHVFGIISNSFFTLLLNFDKEFKWLKG